MVDIIQARAEPYFFPGNKTGCLMIHGFTGSPTETRWMGEFLAAQGYTVLGVRLAGHGTKPEDLNRARWQDWLANVEDGWQLLQGATERIFVIGLSMGGVLALSLAAKYPAAGVVTMSTPYELDPDPRLRFAKLISLFIPYQKKGRRVVREPEVYDWHVNYSVNPVRAGVELYRLLVHMRAELAKVTAPTLLIHSHADRAVPIDNMAKIFENLASEDKTMIDIQESQHLITLEPERDEVYQAAANFIQRISGRMDSGG